MDTRKMTLFATIAAIALLAVGIGYAYTASTSNSGNNVTTDYVTIVQDNANEGSGAYTFAGNAKIHWNSDDYKDGQNINTKFTLDGVATNVATGYALTQIGDSFVLKTAPQTGGTAAADVTCAITQTGFSTPEITGSTKTTAIFLKVVAATNDQAVTSLFKLDNESFRLFTPGTPETLGASTFTIYDVGNGYGDVTITAYYGYAGTAEDGIIVTHYTGEAPLGPSAQPLDDASLKFTVTIQ